MGETEVLSLGLEDPLEKGMATHSSILAWRIPWTEEPGGLQSMGSRRIQHDWVTNNSFRCKQILRVRIKGEPMILQDSTLYFKGFHLVLLKRTYWISLRPSEGSEVSQQSCSLSDSECVIAPAALCTPHILLSLPKLSDSPDFPVTQDGSLETHSLQLKDSMSYTA